MSATATWARRAAGAAIALLAILAAACGGGDSGRDPSLAGVAPDTLARWMEEARPLVLFDVRPDSLFEASRIVGSIRAQGLALAALGEVLPDRPEVPVIFVSEHGERPPGTPDRDAREAGHERVLWLEGGIAAWRAAGHPVVGSRSFAD